MSDNPVRVRFAPSPTGYLHIGGARTALFNYLFARKHRGVFVLRIEDTDRERSTPQAVQAILDGMRYLGLNWDEGPGVGGDHGPYFQSERLPSYTRLVDQLLSAGKAYRCFCSKERLDGLREGQKAAKERIHYDRRCLAIPPADAAARAATAEPAVVRLRIPEGRTVVPDIIRGEVVFENAELDDFIIRRADGTCVYNFAVVGDDAGMRITHVVRGEDHLSNTPKQILIFQSLGLPVPLYAHIPLILGPGRDKLSKRHGAVSVTEYERAGYLPEAMINFLARMGWSYDDKQEILSLDELVEKFSLDGISKSGAVYDIKKLNHLGAHYIRRRPLDEIAALAVPRLIEAGLLTAEQSAAGRENLIRMISLEKDRIEHLSQIVEKLRFYFEEPRDLDPQAQKALAKREGIVDVVARYRAAIEKSFPTEPKPLEEAARRFAEAEKLPLGDLAQPLRAILTGRSATPPLFEVMAILGRETCLQRLAKAREIIAAASQPSTR